MVFILGTNFADRLLVKRAVGSFFGVGPHTCTNLLARFHIHPTAKVSELDTKQVMDLTAALTDMKIENDLRRSILDNIKRLRDTGTYRGRRHAMGYPVRGQQTKKNARTAIRLNRIDRKL